MSTGRESNVYIAAGKAADISYDVDLGNSRARCGLPHLKSIHTVISAELLPTGTFFACEGSDDI